jgi:hypothetical protein
MIRPLAFPQLYIAIMHRRATSVECYWFFSYFGMLVRSRGVERISVSNDLSQGAGETVRLMPKGYFRGRPYRGTGT